MTAAATATAIAAALFQRLEQTWNEADGAGFGAVFTADADFVDIRGTHHRGDTTIGDGHQAIFDGIYAGSTVSYQLDTAREIGSGCIAAVAGATLDAPGGPLRGVNHSRITAVITAQDDGWAIAAFQNTLIVGAAS
jgi:uncharacterized protein (TIGR02246 family)